MRWVLRRNGFWRLNKVNWAYDETTEERMNPLTVAELRLRQAQLAEKAERLRQEGATTSGASPRAAFLARSARQHQVRADDYAALLRIAEGTT